MNQNQTQSISTQQTTNTSNNAQSQSNVSGNQQSEPVFVQVRQVHRNTTTSSPQASSNSTVNTQQT